MIAVLIRFNLHQSFTNVNTCFNLIHETKTVKVIFHWDSYDNKSDVTEAIFSYMHNFIIRIK